MNKNQPLFIFGCYRSGTSLLRLILNAHSQIFLPEEALFLPVFGHKIEKYGSLEQVVNWDLLVRDILFFLKRKACWRHVPSFEQVVAFLPSEPSYQDVIRAVIFAAADKDVDSLAYWGDKTPVYINSLFYLNELFPDAKFINVVRDGRDVAASVKKEVAWGGRTPMAVAEEWSLRVLNGMLGERLIGIDRFLTVRYEALVSSPKKTLRRITDFLRIQYDNSMLAYHQTSSAQELARYNRHKNVARPISTCSVGRYKERLTEEEIAQFESVAGNTLLALGYDVHISPGVRPVQVLKDYFPRVYRGIMHRLLVRLPGGR